MDSALLTAAQAIARFDGFGPTRYALEQPPLTTIEISPDREKLRRTIRKTCPTQTGVYGMLDKHRQLVYVGMSGQLRARLLTYFYNRLSDEKQQRIARFARRVVWEVHGHEFTARLRELELIRRWRPTFNVRGQPGHTRSGYICLTADDAPCFRIDRLPTRRHQAFWGPVPLNHRMRFAVERLNHLFKLRDCPPRTRMIFNDQRQLFDLEYMPLCQRGDLGTCLAPCAGRCTRHEYANRTAAARAVLDGMPLEALASIDTDSFGMTKRNDLRQAEERRDPLDDLTYLTDQLALARDVQKHYHFVYPVVDHLGGQLWNLVAGGHVVQVIEEPNSTRLAERCLEALKSRYDKGELLECDDFDIIRMVVSWFRRHTDQREMTLQPPQALEHCRKLLSKKAA